MNLRQRLLDREVRLLAFVNVADPALVEVAAHGGFDAVIIDAEHGPLSMHDIQDLIRAADAVAVPAMVRVPTRGREFILRALDAGASGVLVPQIDSAADAGHVVAECRFPPVGTRGAGFYARSYRYSLDRGRPALDSRDDSISAGIQIESVEAVERAEEILDVPGLDYVFVGPTDLSVSHGSCDPTHPWVVAAIESVAEKCRARGIPSGIYAANPDNAGVYAAMGYDTIAVGMLPMLVNAATAFTGQARQSFDRGGSRG
jgi:2-keto-3-deoxy-L-rhamnonate aldolase RhmA